MDRTSITEHHLTRCAVCGHHTFATCLTAVRILNTLFLRPALRLLIRATYKLSIRD